MDNNNTAFTCKNEPPIDQPREWFKDGICPHGCNSWLIELGLI